ncbi:hypothetical protein DYH10_03240 [Candidatus Saccharibacteria bacterium CPR2]|nr:hypothetical protein [Candidatus Saccharibacteria bacterium CPR2]
MKKDVIYIDADDDITAIIDKVKGSSAKIIALVPPKRSTVLQSLVNMKLLKRTADDASKRIVLITNEQSLLPLAGGIGLYVARNLQSKPYIPEAKGYEPSAKENVIDESGELDESHKVLSHKPSQTQAVPPKAPTSFSKDKPASPKKKRIPSFEKFRTKLFLIIGGVLLLAILWFVAFWVMPKANIVIKAQTSRIEINESFNVGKNLETNNEKNTFKAEEQTLSKTVTEKFKATGEKNIGNKASGTITVQNCDSSSSIEVPAGTTFTSSGGLSFVSSQAATVSGGSFSGGSCSAPGENNVTVTADKPGGEYNLASGTSYTLSGQSGFVTGYGGQMSGGTTQMAKVITQADVDEAKNKLSQQNNEEAKQELSAKFNKDSTYILGATFTVTSSQPTVSPAVDTQADEGTATMQITYTMLALSKDEFNSYLDFKIEGKIDKNKQEIYENGIENIKLSLTSQDGSKTFLFSAKANAYVGPKYDKDEIAKEISGKRFSEVIKILESRPGVNSADVKFSPFWVSKAPRPSRINIEFEVSEHNLQ